MVPCTMPKIERSNGMDSILSLIKEILNDILSPVMGKGITSFMEKLHKMRFKKTLVT